MKIICQQKEKDIQNEEIACAKGQRNDNIRIKHFIIREEVNVAGEGKKQSYSRRQKGLKYHAKECDFYSIWLTDFEGAVI